MIYLLVILGLSSSPASGGWFKDFCSRHLIGDDPHQYFHVKTEDLLVAYKATAVEVALYQNDEKQRRISAKRLVLMGDELRSRPLSPYAQFIARAYLHLEYYGR